jgi:hypothetical protein
MKAKAADAVRLLRKEGKSQITPMTSDDEVVEHPPKIKKAQAA